MKRRVAIFAPVLITGGTQRHLQQVLLGLDPTRFEAIVYTLRAGGEVADELEAAGIPVRVAPIWPHLWSPRALGTVWRLARELRSEGVGVVHGYQWRPALIGALAARLAGVPVVLASKRSLSAESRSERWAWRVVGALVDAIVVPAEALRDEARRHGIRCRLVVLRNGIDLTRFRPLGAASERAKVDVGLDPGRPVVGAVGRLEARKGHDALLAAVGRMAEHTNGSAPQVLLVGDGPERNALEAQASALAISRLVHFAGCVGDVRPHLAAMDVFVLPSREEGSSNAVLEAMASARAVVATNVGGNAELIDDGRTGRLVPPDDAVALEYALRELLTTGEQARRLGEAARTAVEVRYDVAGMVTAIEALYETQRTEPRT